MDTAKAIQLLHRLQDEQFDGIHGDERREALSMAVRALEPNLVKESGGLVKDLVNDCISRNMAIDAFEPEHDTDWYTPQIIEVLEALPPVQPQACDDVISRDDAIMAVKTGALSAATTFGRTDEGATAYYETVKAIKALPSAQPHWIPCSERLPEDNVPVNITWINRKPEFYYAEIKDVPFTATGVYFKGKWYWYSSTVEDYLAEYGRAEWDEIEEAMHNSIEVVAWMPLPKPYGGESDV